MSKGRNTQVTTWRRFTAAEKKAYRLRELKRRQWRALLKARVFADLYSGRTPDEEAMRAFGWAPDGFRVLGTTTGRIPRPHRFADDLGYRVPTARVNRDFL